MAQASVLSPVLKPIKPSRFAYHFPGGCLPAEVPINAIPSGSSIRCPENGDFAPLGAELLRVKDSKYGPGVGTFQAELETRNQLR